MKKETKAQAASAAVKKLLSIMLALVMLFSITAGIEMSAYAANGVQTKIESIAKKYPNNSYFSKNGKACSHSRYEGCNNCKLGSINSAAGKVCGTDWWTCKAFANYAFYSIYGISPSASSNKVTTVNASDLNKTAKYGDLIICNDTTSTNFTLGKSPHASIYLGADGTNNCFIYESNYKTPNKVAYKRSIKTSTYKKYKIIHANNYDKINGSTSTSTTNNHTLTVNYNVNGGRIDSSTYKEVNNFVCKRSTNEKFGQTWTYNQKQKDGLYNASTFGLYRNGYDFLGWGTTPSGGKFFDQNDTSVLPTDINPDVKTKNCSTTLYALWTPSKLETPELLPVTVNDDGSFKINWLKDYIADKYEVYVSDSVSGSYKLMYTTTNGHIVTNPMPFGVTKYYKIKAINTSNNSLNSNLSSAVSATNTKKLLKPGITKISVNSNGTFTLNWEKITGADKYEVYSSTDGKSYSLFKTVTGSTTLTATNRIFGRTYYFKVRALKNGNSAVTSDFGSAKSAVNNKKLLKPGITNIKVNSNGSFTLNWEKITGADKYEIYSSTDGKSYSLFKTVTNTTTFIATNRIFGKTYYFKVRAVKNNNSTVTSDFSPAKSAVNNKKLLKPGITNIKVNSNGSFTLNWEKITGADKYELYYKQDDGSYKLLKTVTGTSYTSGFAQYGKQYSYKMKAVTSKNSSATSNYSSVVNATNNKKLQTPTLKVSVNSNGTFKMTWNKVTGATSYQIYYKQADGSYKLLKTVTGTSYTSGFAQYGKQYSYKVRAVTSKNSSATSNFSSVVNAKNTKKLGTPTLKATVNKNGSFKLSWGKVTGATSYQIYWKQANGSYKLLKTVTGTSYTTVVAQKGKTYSYKVRAVTKNNSSATSNYSSVVSAKRK